MYDFYYHVLCIMYLGRSVDQFGNVGTFYSSQVGPAFETVCCYSGVGLKINRGTQRKFNTVSPSHVAALLTHISVSRTNVQGGKYTDF